MGGLGILLGGGSGGLNIGGLNIGGLGRLPGGGSGGLNIGSLDGNSEPGYPGVGLDENIIIAIIILIIRRITTTTIIIIVDDDVFGAGVGLGVVEADGVLTGTAPVSSNNFCFC